MKVFALIGSMGSGKTTLYNKLVNEGLYNIREATTRQMRPGEENSKQYIFVPNDIFDEYVKYNMLIGTSNFTIQNGQVYRYGFNVLTLPTDREEDCVVQANYQNIDDLKKFYGDNLIVIKLSRDIDSILESLKQRGDNPDEIISRINRDEQQYSNISFDYHFKNRPVDEIVKTINLMR